jgi:hypothetical protein
VKTLVGAAEPEDRPPFGPQVTLTTSSANVSTAVVVWSNTMPSFVCGRCKKGDHTTCDPKHCDCQHKEQ